jgi:hypothetical protein
MLLFCNCNALTRGAAPPFHARQSGGGGRNTIGYRTKKLVKVLIGTRNLQ